MVVGRLAELTALVDATRHTIRGRGAVAVVIGEVGIGKTHLLESLDVAVASLGVAFYAASAHELDQRRLFGPLLDALAVDEGAHDRHAGRPQAAGALSTASVTRAR